MSRIIFPRNYVECPLCDKAMREVVTPKGAFWSCFTDTCMISINKKDPAVGRWNEHPENAPICPRCGSRMRMFFRSTDTFMVCQCPRCTKDGHMVEVRKGYVEHMDPNWSWDEGEGE